MAMHQPDGVLAVCYWHLQHLCIGSIRKWDGDGIRLSYNVYPFLHHFSAPTPFSVEELHSYTLCRLTNLVFFLFFSSFLYFTLLYFPFLSVYCFCSSASRYSFILFGCTVCRIIKRFSTSHYIMYITFFSSIFSSSLSLPQCCVYILTVQM